MALITSRNNSKVKAARVLKRRKARRKAGAFLVEGIRQVGEAVEAGAALQSIFYAPELLDSAFAQALIQAQGGSGLPCYATTPEVFASLSERENPQGILAVVKQPVYVMDNLSPEKYPWIVALVSPQDPGNIGTILRTMDAVSAGALILLDGGADPYHPTVVRASLGTLFWIPLVETTFQEFEIWAGRHGYNIYGASARAETGYREIDYHSPGVLLMGSEREGLNKEQVNVCNHLVRLPMRGRSTSLNLAVAAGLMLYAMLESRREDPKGFQRSRT